MNPVDRFPPRRFPGNRQFAGTTGTIAAIVDCRDSRRDLPRVSERDSFIFHAAAYSRPQRIPSKCAYLHFFARFFSLLFFPFPLRRNSSGRREGPEGQIAEGKPVHSKYFFRGGRAAGSRREATDGRTEGRVKGSGGPWPFFVETCSAALPATCLVHLCGQKASPPPAFEILNGPIASFSFETASCARAPLRRTSKRKLRIKNLTGELPREENRGGAGGRAEERSER